MLLWENAFRRKPATLQGVVGAGEMAFSGCFKARGYRGAVEDQMREAFGHGFRGTPSFMINDTPLTGPPTFEFLDSLIEDQLN